MLGGKQLGFADYEQTTAKKRTKKEKFLAEMDQVVPWKALIDLIEPHYPKPSSKGATPCCINSIRPWTRRSWAVGPDLRPAAGALDLDLAEDFWRDWVTAMAGWTWNAPLVLA